MRIELDLTGKKFPLKNISFLSTIILFFRAEGENPVLPGAVQSNTKSDDEEDQYDDDPDEQCKYNSETIAIELYFIGKVIQLV